MTTAKVFLTREQLLAALPLPLAFEEVECPELGGWVRVNELSIADARTFETAVGRGGNIIQHELLLALTLTDTDGKRIFTDEDAVELGKRKKDELVRLGNIAMRLNGYSKADEEALRGNSSGGGSSSA